MIQHFNSGIVDIYKAEDIAPNGKAYEEKLTRKYKLQYSERTVGINRYYAAMQNNVKVDVVIRTHRLLDVTTDDKARTHDGCLYKIIQIQYPDKIEPPCMDLTLERIG